LVVKQLKVNEQLESFKCFHDLAWALKMEEKTRQFPKLHKLFTEFVAEWRMTAETFTFPWMASEMMRSMVDGFNKSVPKSYQWITMLREGIEPELEDIVGKPKAAKVLKLLYRNDERALTHAMESEIPFNAQAFYEQNIHDEHFAMMLVGIQQQCFVFLWIAYEDLVVKLYEVVADYWTTPSVKKKDKGNPPTEGYQTGSSTAEDFKKAFGEPITSKCWTDKEIAQIREYRHAFVHERGKLSNSRAEKLKKMAIPKLKDEDDVALVSINSKNIEEIHTLDDSLVIMTHENRIAYNTLKASLNELLEHIMAINGSKFS
jgi:hypothetical protein